MFASDAGTLDLIKLDEMLSDTLPCESRDIHIIGKWGHDPAQGAAWLVMAPCGAARFMCDSGWQTIVRAGGFSCTGDDTCGADHFLGEISVRPI